MFEWAFDLIFSSFAKQASVWLLGIFTSVTLFLIRRSVRRIPLAVFFERNSIVCKNSRTLIAVPGFLNPALRVGRTIERLPNSVRLIGLLDALALHRLLDTLVKTFDLKAIELRMHDRFDQQTNPIISVGGASVNEMTGSILSKTFLQRGISMSYPAHILRVLGEHFVAEIVADRVEADYGILLISRSKWNEDVGCCVVFGIYPAGTSAAVRLIEDPMRTRLLESLTQLSAFNVWLRLLLDRVRVRRFSELVADWVVVVKCELSGDGLHPGEPRIVVAKKLPPIPDDTKGWDRSALLDFWNRVASSPGWTAVAGDEPDLSTTLVREWVGSQLFLDEDLLDYGCGPGRLFEAFIQRGLPKSLTAIDRERQMLARAEEGMSTNLAFQSIKVKFIHGDVFELKQLISRSVTTAICWTVLNHIIDDTECEEILVELCRVASRRIILCEPLCKSDEAPVVFAAFPSKRRSRSFYDNLLSKNGFTVDFSNRRFGSPAHPEAERGVFIALRLPQDC
jgi:2-polyprenyl-3-methyl-5-hydroxy-6-metoxy-1,4-benzoquinol methylase